MMGLFIVTGPPAAGKSTWVREQLQAGDIVIDFDAIAHTISPNTDLHDHPPHVAHITKSTRSAAIQQAIRFRNLVNVYVIHSTPSDSLMKKYKSLGATTIVIDPGQDVVMQRIEQERPPLMAEVARDWYYKQDAQHIK